ncbi:MAG: regulatory protein GemA [Pseudomonadota bacterium]
MTARAKPAQFDAASQHRRALLAKVHVAKKQLQLADDDYRAVIYRVTGNISAGACTEKQLAAVVEAFARQGFDAKARPAGPRPADHPAARKARALWISLYQLGAIENPSEQALEAFARRQLKVDRLQWADQALSYRLIEALKAIAARHGWNIDLAGVRPEAGPLVLKRRLVDAILVKLQNARLVPAAWGGRRTAFDLVGMTIASVLGATAEELEVLAKALGQKLREAGA